MTGDYLGIGLLVLGAMIVDAADPSIEDAIRLPTPDEVTRAMVLGLGIVLVWPIAALAYFLGRSSR